MRLTIPLIVGADTFIISASHRCSTPLALPRR